MRNRRRVVLMMLTIVLLSSAAFAQSQATTGVIEGTVSDSSGAVLPGATVTLKNTGTNFTRDLVTDGDGRFRGLLLPLGTYRLTVSAGRLLELRAGRHRARRRPDREHPDRAAGRRRGGEDYGHERLARRRDHALRGVDADQPAGASRPSEQRPQLPRASCSSRPA